MKKIHNGKLGLLTAGPKFDLKMVCALSRASLSCAWFLFLLCHLHPASSHSYRDWMCCEGRELGLAEVHAELAF